ncbi:hypothetical protein BD311DRAFT_755989 [Dichomitus squalens]|uniref:Uncharacterized protein n=1 Tax=Dichomitus squalens TaxID=114155 RepID=A0A4Q9MPH8_9APHY|nr:hypothetical protein BD311DRAFT_755989 [Dichomitus squalens]
MAEHFQRLVRLFQILHLVPRRTCTLCQLDACKKEQNLPRMPSRLRLVVPMMGAVAPGLLLIPGRRIWAMLMPFFANSSTLQSGAVNPVV